MVDKNEIQLKIHFDGLIGIIGDIDAFIHIKNLRNTRVYQLKIPSGTSVRPVKQTYSGVRDASRVLYQMSMMMLANELYNSSSDDFFMRRPVGYLNANFIAEEVPKFDN